MVSDSLGMMRRGGRIKGVFPALRLRPVQPLSSAARFSKSALQPRCLASGSGPAALQMGAGRSLQQTQTFVFQPLMYYILNELLTELNDESGKIMRFEELNELGIATRTAITGEA